MSSSESDPVTDSVTGPAAGPVSAPRAASWLDAAPARAVEAAYRALFGHVLTRVDPEVAHRAAFAALRGAARVPVLAAAVRRALAPPPEAAVELAGVRFPGRFGMAAGFDKDARGVLALTMLGFAWVEVGTVTAHPQPGNERPRLWRETALEGLRNRMGFNNEGSDAVAARLARLRATPLGARAVVGVNIGRSRVVAPEDAPADYARTARALAGVADYLVVNVSSPNTPGLRDLQAVAALRPLLQAVTGAVAEAGHPQLPVLVKIAPDLTDEDVDAVADLVTALDLAGVVAVNTTTAHDLGPGGLSGPPLLARGTAVVARLRGRLGAGRLVIGVGGVSRPGDALAYAAAGADLLQGYTGFVYAGPWWAARLNRALAGAAPTVVPLVAPR